MVVSNFQPVAHYVPRGTSFSPIAVDQCSLDIAQRVIPVFSMDLEFSLPFSGILCQRDPGCLSAFLVQTSHVSRGILTH